MAQQPPESDDDIIEDKDIAGAASTLRSIGSAFGRWGRRVGTFISEGVSGEASVPEALRESLDKARDLRLTGDPRAARQTLRDLSRDYPDNLFVDLDLALTLCAQALIDNQAIGELVGASEKAGRQRKKPGYLPLLTATKLLLQGDPERALDALRRGQRSVKEIHSRGRDEAQFYIHLLTTMANIRLGRHERALLELHRCRVALPEGAGATLRRHLILEGAGVLLAEDHLDEAAAWLTTMVDEQEPGGDDPRATSTGQLATAWLARTYAAKGESERALALVGQLPDDPAWLETRVRIGLCLGQVGDTQARALKHLQADPSDWARQRLWALAELASWRARASKPSAGTRTAVIEALKQAVRCAPEGQRERYLHELAHIALRAEYLTKSDLEPVLAYLEEVDATPEELRLAATRLRYAEGKEPLDADFLAGPPPRYRKQPDVGGTFGPDEVSPLRNPTLRLRILRSQRALAEAEYCLYKGHLDYAQEALVQALAQAPELAQARKRLTELAGPPPGSRLEGWLTAATETLAGIPNNVLGVSLAGIQEALANVISARERLARPLTLAVMGEFSSGKSTFVNALLGEAIAPMGVLPTTSTINVFRRGPGGIARIHYRDGQISTLPRDQIHPFLHGLDDIEAAKIRHIEIERSGVHMGDAAVVDTPGLNALDGFHETVAREFIDEADAVIWIFSATRGGSGSEAGLLRALQADGRRVLGVLNKVDTLDDEEREELCEYLQEQLGEVLVDIIPVCATKALAHRSGEDTSGKDPFAAIEQTLETVFFKQARTLKRNLTARRLADALKSARKSVVDATKILETLAQTDGDSSHDDAAEQLALRRFADRLHEVVLSHDDLLVREGLALGLLKSGSGTTRELSEQDTSYLNAVLRDNLLRGLQGVVQDMARKTDTPAVTQVLGEQLIPWARGYLASLDAAGFARGVLTERGTAISKGEAAARQEFRHALVPVADAWRVFVRSLDREVARVRELHEHHRVSAPRAEILRLETTAIARLDALIERAEAGEAIERSAKSG